MYLFKLNLSVYLSAYLIPVPLLDNLFEYLAARVSWSVRPFARVVHLPGMQTCPTSAPASGPMATGRTGIFPLFKVTVLRDCWAFFLWFSPNWARRMTDFRIWFRFRAKKKYLRSPWHHRVVLQDVINLAVKVGCVISVAESTVPMTLQGQKCFLEIVLHLFSPISQFQKNFTLFLHDSNSFGLNKLCWGSSLNVLKILICNLSV